MSSLIISGSYKARDVFVFPTKKLSTKEKDKHILKITSKLNNLKSPKKDEKAKAVLSRLAHLPCETEKVRIIDTHWVKNLSESVENLPGSSLDKDFEKPL